MLGNPPSFSLSDLCLANGIEQGGFPVIDVSHNRHHRRTILEVLQILLVDHFRAFAGFRFGFGGFDEHAQFFSDQGRRRHIQGLGDVDGDPFHKQPFDNFRIGDG